MPFDPPYTAMLPTITQLPGTGQGLANRAIDPNWQIVAIDDQPLVRPEPLRVNNSPNYTNLVPNDPDRSQWISYDPAIDEDHVCTFRATLTLPEGVDPARARIELRCFADTQVKAIAVNGNRRVLDTGPAIFGTWEQQTIQITEHLNAGQNTIEFDVANLQPAPHKSANIVGLKLEWQLIAQPGWRSP